MPYLVPFGGSVNVEVSEGGVYAPPNGGSVGVELADSGLNVVAYVSDLPNIYISAKTPKVVVGHTLPAALVTITPQVPFAGRVLAVSGPAEVLIGTLPATTRKANTADSASVLVGTVAPVTLSGKITSVKESPVVSVEAHNPTHMILLRVARSIKYTAHTNTVDSVIDTVIAAHAPTQLIPIKLSFSTKYTIWAVAYGQGVIRYSFSLAKSLSTRYDIRRSIYGSLGVVYSVSTTDSISRGIAVVYSVQLCVGFSTPYNVLTNQPVSSATRVVYSLRDSVSAGISAAYSVVDSAIVVRQSVSTPYSYLSHVGAQYAATYSYASEIRTSKAINYRLASDVAQGIAVDYAVLDHNKVAKQFRAIWSAPANGSVAISSSVYIDIRGSRVDILEGDISVAEGEYAWSGNFVLSGVEDYAKFRKLDEISVVFYAETFKMVVVGKEMSRTSPASISCRLICSSPTVLLAAPSAKTVDILWEEDVLATDAVADVVGGYPVPVVWDAIDWLIPKFRLAFSKTSPIDVIDTLSSAIGCMPVPEPDGSLVVRKKYPISVPDYASATPVHVLGEAFDIFTASEDFAIPEVYNKFRIRDADNTDSDILEWIPDEGNTYSGIIRAYPFPWREVNLVHTGAISVSIVYPPTETIEEYTELVEIYEGKGSTQHPIFDLLGVTWEATDLHGLAFTQYSSDVSVTGDVYNGLVYLRYASKSVDFRVSSSEGKPVQFLLESSPIT